MDQKSTYQQKSQARKLRIYLTRQMRQSYRPRRIEIIDVNRAR